MAAVRKRAEWEHLPQAATVPVILLNSSGSDSDDSEASEDEGKMGRGVEGRSKPEAKLVPDEFLDPLPPSKPSRSSKRYGKKNKLEHTQTDDTGRGFLLKLLQDHNKPRWKKNDTWVKGAWDRITQAFNKKYTYANASKNQLQDRLYLMKKTYKGLKQLSELSGLHWDRTNNMLQGPENVWKKLLPTNKDAKKWYNTPWPYYSTCQELFEGKSVNEEQSGGADYCEERVTPQPLKTSQNLNSPPLHSAQQTHQKKPSQAPSGYESIAMKRKSDQCRETTRLPHDERDFSIQTCMEAFYKLDGFTRHDVFEVSRIFRSIENREMFLSLRAEDREFWLRAEMDAV